MRRPQYLLPIFVLSTLTACGSDPDTSEETTFSSFTGTGEETASETSGSSSSSESQGEGSETAGDGDGDGSGEASESGDGDGDSSGDGDGDSSGDGDGDSSGDGDGDGDSSGDGDGDSSGDGDGDGDGATTGPTPCSEQPVNVSPVIPNVMLVLDKSNSMFANEWVPPGLPSESRWQTLHGVVSSTVNSFNTVVNFGSIIYPASSTTSAWGVDACQTSSSDLVSVSAGMQAATDVIDSLPAANLAADGAGSAGATPTYAGLQEAYDELQPIYDADPTVPAFVILMTDGAANCDTTITGGADTDALCTAGSAGLPSSDNNLIMQTYDPRLEPSVTAALTAGIPTFVVGIDMTENEATCPPSGLALRFCGDPWKDDSATCHYDADAAGGSEVEPWAKLDTLAEEGGREQVGGASKFYNADDPQAFQDALADIISSVQSCVIPLDTPPPFPQTGVDVWIPDDSDPANKAPLVTNCLTEDGWVYTDASFTAIELCGTFCDKLKTEQVADVEIGRASCRERV